MKSILAIFFVFILTIFPTSNSYNAFASALTEEGKDDKKKPSIKVSSVAADDVNLEEDVPGNEDNYYRCAISCWRISEGWFDFFTVLTSGTATFLGSLAATLDSPSLKVAAPIVGGVATLMMLFKRYAQTAVKDRQEKLKEVIQEHHRNQRASSV
jgi:hypothetical protein